MDQSSRINLDSVTHISKADIDGDNDLMSNLLRHGAVFQPDTDGSGGYSISRARGPENLILKSVVRLEISPDSPTEATNI